MIGRSLAGVVIGAILGCIATGILVGLVNGGFVGFVTTWGKYVVSILIALPTLFYFRALSRAAAAIVSIVSADVLAVLVTVLIFAPGAPALMVALFNLPFAIVTVLVFMAITGGARTTAAAA